MTEYTYKCVVAPRRVKKTREHRSPAEALAAALEAAIAIEVAAGWEYMRTDLVPMEAKSGWFSSVTESHQGVMVFRRPAQASAAVLPLPAEERVVSPRAEPRVARPPAPTEPEVPRLGAARID